MISSLTSIASICMRTNDASASTLPEVSSKKLSGCYNVTTSQNYAVCDFSGTTFKTMELTTFTFEAWCYPKTRAPNNWGQGFFGLGSASNYITIVYDERVGTLDPGFRWSVCDQDINFNSSGKKLIATIDTYLNTWTHVAVTRDSSNVMKLFINGTMSTSATSNFSYKNFTGLVVCRAFFSESTIFPATVGSSITGIRLSNIDRYNNNFTPSKNEYINDSNTIFAFNFTSDSNKSVNEMLTLVKNGGTFASIPANSNF